MIQLRALTKRYGSFTAVDAIDLDVPRGQLFGFLGPNGAGKTTTLRMIAGILRPTSGSVHIGGVDLAADPAAAKAKLGFIPDRPFIYEKLTGAEFLRFVAGLYGQDGAAVVLDWAESGGPPILAPPVSTGFGTKLLTRGLFDLSEGGVHIDYLPDGVRCRMVIGSLPSAGDAPAK